MKILHIADLHLGKRLCEFPLLDDQKYILDEIIQIVDKKRIDAVLIAGDVYDKSTPPAEAVALADSFITELARRAAVLIVSGNHDSAERLAFGAGLMRGGGVYISRVFAGAAERVTLGDEFGDVEFTLLPFVRPAELRRFFASADPDSPLTFSEMARLAVGEPREGVRNVLAAHQLVAGADLRCQSETLSVGGAEAVSPSAFAGYDYTALGHLHGEQRAGAENIRYSGSPLKYSFSEAGRGKYALVVTLGAHGFETAERVPLEPLRDLRETEGRLADILLRGADDPRSQDYLRVTLDDDFAADAMARVRTVYPNAMQLAFRRSAAAFSAPEAFEDSGRSLFEWFCEFYEKQNGSPLSGGARELARSLMAESEARI